MTAIFITLWIICGIATGVYCWQHHREPNANPVFEIMIVFIICALWPIVIANMIARRVDKACEKWVEKKEKEKDQNDK